MNLGNSDNSTNTRSLEKYKYLRIYIKNSQKLRNLHSFQNLQEFQELNQF